MKRHIAGLRGGGRKGSGKVGHARETEREREEDRRVREGGR
jgi:hypothetical protein